MNLKFSSFLFYGMILFNQEAEREGKRKIESEEKKEECKWLNVPWLETTSSSNHYEKISIDGKRSFTGVSTITTSNHSCCTFKCVLFDSLGSILSWLMYRSTTASKVNFFSSIDSAFLRNLLCKLINLVHWLIFRSGKLVKTLLPFPPFRHWLYGNICLVDKLSWQLKMEHNIWVLLCCNLWGKQLRCSNTICRIF